MFRTHLISRAFQIGACGALLLAAAPAKSEPKSASASTAPAGKAKKGGASRACATAFKSAQEREQAAHFREAKELLQSCAKAACGALQKECSAKYSRLDANMPSIVPVVMDNSGQPRVDVQVRMDGELLTSRLDGRALAVDPGWHEFSFGTDSGVFAKQNVMIVEGQRSRVLSIKGGHAADTRTAAVPAPAPIEASAPPSQNEKKPVAEAPAPEPVATEMPAHEMASSSSSEDWAPRRRTSALPYVVGGAGVVALGAGALLTVWGKKDNDKLNGCSPDCSQASVDRVRRLYTIADISLGVGVAALGVATYLYVKGDSTREKPPETASYSFDVKPTPAGAFATVAGSF